MAPFKPGAGKSVHYKRHKELRDQITVALAKPSIRRLARRGGVIRMSESVYNETHVVLKQYLEDIIKNLAELLYLCRRKMVLTTDVVYVLKQTKGVTLYGFEKLEEMKRPED